MKRSQAQPWQPLTLAGVAGFAHGSVWRLLIVELVVALLVAASVVAAAALGWAPAVDQAVERAPATGAGIREAHLHWPGMLPEKLTQNQFLDIVVVGDETMEIGQVADVQVELGRSQWKIRSLLGYMDFPYPSGEPVDLTKQHIDPWWGARKPFILASLGGTVIVTLQLLWAALALCYALPVRLLTFYADRPASFWQSWKLAFAALMPGALLMGVAILLYGLSRLPLAALLGALGVHLVLGWGYLAGATFRLPRVKAGRGPGRSNPFMTARASDRKL